MIGRSGRIAALCAGLMVPLGTAAPAETPMGEVPASGALPGGAGTVALLPGWREPAGAHLAALSLSLAPGWKTYWRVPGEAGIPPGFDWTGSRNVARVVVHWPRPVAFDQGGMTSLGYGGEVVLPIEVIPADPSRPVDLAGVVSLGVCRDICIPVTARLAGHLAPPGAPDARIRAALDHTPEALSGQATCAVAPIADGLRLTVRLPMPRDGVQAVAVEAPDPAVWVSQAALSDGGGALVATVDLVPPSGAPFALDRSGLRFTVVAGAQVGELTGCSAG
jgi:DsbC/DsbD-like thiol-disulfide interchange protein